MSPTELPHAGHGAIGEPVSSTEAVEELIGVMTAFVGAHAEDA